VIFLARISGVVVFDVSSDELEGLVSDVFVTAAALQPVHVGFAAEPG
jgi:hypothetical protein